jgi:hypothetical protein
MPRVAKKPKAKKKAPSKMVAYVGILDTLGLDSFTEMNNRNAMHMSLRAALNPQRHACVFLAYFDEGASPLEHIRKFKDPWDMWSYINVACRELQCDPKDAKTIKNMKKLADAKIQCTGSAW